MLFSLYSVSVCPFRLFISTKSGDVGSAKEGAGLLAKERGNRVVWFLLFSFEGREFTDDLKWNIKQPGTFMAILYNRK